MERPHPFGGDTMSRKIAGMTAAALLTFAPVAFAQSQTPKQEPTPEKTVATTQTFTGCVMTEPDYRRAHNLGKGALNGMGLGDEYVLVDVKVTPAKGTTDMTTSSDSSSTSASRTESLSSACADKGAAYRLNGSQEPKVKGFVGHWMEVQGRFKHADDVTANGTEPGEKLPPEVEILSFREAPAPAVTTTTTPEPVVRTTPKPVLPPASAATPVTPTTEPREAHSELPHTASSSALLAVIGFLALGSGVILTVARRRAL
jgi:LPXTG-motif cell wall-anchored protein